MKMNISLIIGLIITTLNANASQRVRKVEVHKDQIVTVRTSLGIATIIQVPDKPNSVVVGDQESFKVEYLDQAITIKPLTSGAKSNLYIYTDWKRYNVELVSGAEVTADYVVYLSSLREKTLTPSEIGIKWMKFNNFLRNDSLRLRTERIGKTKSGILLIEFTVTSKTKEAFKPEWVWFTQAGETRPIQNLFLSSLEVTPDRHISGVLQIKHSDINTNLPLRLELRRKRISYLTIPKANSWKL